MKYVKQLVENLKLAIEKYPEIAVIWLILGFLSAFLNFFGIVELSFPLFAIESFLIYEFFTAYYKGENAYENLDKDAPLFFVFLSLSFVFTYLTLEFWAESFWILVFELLAVAFFRAYKLKGTESVTQELLSIYSALLKDTEAAVVLTVLVLITLVSSCAGMLLDPLISLFFLVI